MFVEFIKKKKKLYRHLVHIVMSENIAYIIAMYPAVVTDVLELKLFENSSMAENAVPKWQNNT